MHAARTGQLRRQERECDATCRRLEAQVAHLEKLLDTHEDEAVGRKLGEVQAQLDAARAELDRVRDELEAAEQALVQAAESQDELEHLVDSFAAVAQTNPRLATVLAAMRHLVGALATARRLERAHPTPEARDVAASLTAALTLLAETLSRAQLEDR